MIEAGTHFGRYEIKSLLGAGGMGEVYLAEDKNLGRKVAIKLLPSDLTKNSAHLHRFEQEARIASSLNHPNILTIHEIGSRGGKRFIVMEFVEGETLRKRLATRRMKLLETLDVAMQVASALAAAHEAGIVHRDIKPDNIMLRADAYVKVLDFGIAKLIEQPVTSSEDSTLISTNPGTIIGTVNYMSPEQARGLAVDARTDIWSLGVVLYEMLSEKEAFSGATPSDKLVSILEREPPPLEERAPEILAALTPIVSKALSKNAEKRYQTARDFLSDLKEISQELVFKAKLEDSGQTRTKSSETILTGSSQAATKTSELSEENPAVVSSSGIPSTQTQRKRRSRKKAIDSLAVLPFVNAGNDPNAEYLSDGISESIINSLSQLPQLRVMSWNTVRRYKSADFDPLKIGTDLDIRAIVAGRVFQLGDRLVVKTELIDAVDGSQLWGEQYSRNHSDIFEVQEEISREISEKLRLKLSGNEKKKLVRRYTENAEAYQLYLKGRYHWNKRTREGLKNCIAFFQKAIEKDPNYALAYTGLADAFGILSFYAALPPTDAMPKARAAAMRALEIDKDLAEAHSSLAFVKALYDWDWAGAEKHYRRAIKLNPAYATAHHWYGLVYLTPLARFDEAAKEIKRAQETDPLSLPVNAAMGIHLYFRGEYDASIEQSRKALSLEPNFWVAHYVLGWAYERKGDCAQAIESFEKAKSINDAPLLTAAIGHCYALSGQRDEARNAIEELKTISLQQYVSPTGIARICTALGEKDMALEWLEKACEDHSTELIWLKIDS
ncbi:MAG: protein kinase, partial [Acidobacteriota bacterium]|nr:protein kinase [Acidobacteriota bacterium]